MIHVRKHSRQLGSGKVVGVREHDRSGDRAESAGITRPSEQEDGWWDSPDTSSEASMNEHPPGTWFFRQGDDLMAVHPDGTVHPVDEDDDEPDTAAPSEHPAGTWYFNDHGETYAVYPDGSTHLVPDEPADGPQDDDGGEMCSCGHPLSEACGCRCLGNHPEAPRPGGDGMCQCGHPLAQACGCRCMGNHPRRSRDYGGPQGRHSEPTSTLGRMQDEMRQWRSLPEPQPRPEAPMSPQMTKAMGCDTPEGRAKYDRLRAYREAGYTGPLNQDARIPDPDDPAEYESLSALARMSEI